MIAINVEPVNFNASQNLIERVKTMFARIDRYNDKAVNADIYLKSLRETPTGMKEASIRLNLPGKDIFISKQGPDFISALQLLYDTLKLKLSRHKNLNKVRKQPVLDFH